MLEFMTSRELYELSYGKNQLEIDQLEYYLDEVPDYLANEITAEYSRLKLEFSNKD